MKHSQLTNGRTLPKDVRKPVDQYRNQGGLLGVVSYTLLYLETADEQIAADAAHVPTTLFVASSLHDDAIDETGIDVDKSTLNAQITTGDLFFTDTIDAVQALPATFDGGTVLEAIRTIGSGQLAEESTPTGDPLERAIERVEHRGSVWGALAVAVVEASGRFPTSELGHIDTIMKDLLFVYTLLDDVADLREDRANNTTTAPMLVYAADHPAESSHAPLDRMLDSDLEARIEALIEWREARIACATRLVRDGLDDEELLAALDRALTWYCDSICSVPLAATVPPSVQDDIQSALCDEAERERLLTELSIPAPLPAVEELFSSMDDRTAAQFAPVVSKLLHVNAIVESELVTSAEEAFSSVRAGSTAPPEPPVPDAAE